MTYSEKLKDPRWQKRRLEVLERDKWACTLCLDPESTLHVHHKSYNKNPWDTPLDELVCYCESCHAIIEFNKKNNIFKNHIDALKASIGEAKRIYIIHEDEGVLFISVFHVSKGDVELSFVMKAEAIKKLHEIIFPDSDNKIENG